MAGFNPKMEKQYAQKIFAHLAKGVSPLVASMNPLYAKDPVHGLETQNRVSDIVIGGERIDDGATIQQREKGGMLSIDQHSFIISNCSETDKFSEGYIRCIGLVAVGVDKDSKKEISIMSHADPYLFLDDDETREHFLLGLSNRLKQLKEQCIPGTIDAVMFGGANRSSVDYKKSITLVSEACKNELAFEPTVIAGQGDHMGHLNVYVETQKRHLYFLRPEQKNNLRNQPFMPSDADQQVQSWKETD